MVLPQTVFFATWVMILLMCLATPRRPKLRLNLVPFVPTSWRTSDYRLQSLRRSWSAQALQIWGVNVEPLNGEADSLKPLVVQCSSCLTSENANPKEARFFVHAYRPTALWGNSGSSTWVMCGCCVVASCASLEYCHLGPARPGGRKTAFECPHAHDHRETGT